MPEDAISALASVLKKLEVKVGATFPGENAIAAGLQYAAVARATMSQENRDRQDALALRIQEDTYYAWRRLMELAGILPPIDQMPNLLGGN